VRPSTRHASPNHASTYCWDPRAVSYDNPHTATQNKGAAPRDNSPLDGETTKGHEGGWWTQQPVTHPLMRLTRQRSTTNLVPNPKHQMLSQCKRRVQFTPQQHHCGGLCTSSAPAATLTRQAPGQYFTSDNKTSIVLEQTLRGQAARQCPATAVQPCSKCLPVSPGSLIVTSLSKQGVCSAQ
jgi:hypothetical protein